MRCCRSGICSALQIMQIQRYGIIFPSAQLHMCVDGGQTIDRFAVCGESIPLVCTRPFGSRIEDRTEACTLPFFYRRQLVSLTMGMRTSHAIEILETRHQTTETKDDHRLVVVRLTILAGRPGGIIDSFFSLHTLGRHPSIKNGRIMPLCTLKLL